MKKNITIAGLIILMLVFMIFSFIKADEAEKTKKLAQKHKTEAVREKERADELAKLAEEQAAKSTIAQAEANRIMERLLECQEDK